MRIWHCETQEQYDYLMEQLEAEGFAWVGGDKPTKYNVWDISREQTCVREIGREIVRASKGYFEKKHPDTEIQPVVIPEQKQDKENKKMNKQELIDKLNTLPKYGINAGKFYNVGMGFKSSDVLDLVEKLDEPQKVVLPKDMAEWFDDVYRKYGLEEILDNFSEHFFNNQKFAVSYVDEYCDGNFNEMYRNVVSAYLDGYEVEQEKLYTVVLPNEANSNSHKSFLMRTDTGKIILKHGNFNVKDRTKLTEEEIKSLDERYMAFAEEVTE